MYATVVVTLPGETCKKCKNDLQIVMEINVVHLDLPESTEFKIFVINGVSGTN